MTLFRTEISSENIIEVCVCRIFLFVTYEGDRNAFKVVAVLKCRKSNARNPVRNAYACKSAAVFERAAFYGSNTIRYFKACKVGTSCEG